MPGFIGLLGALQMIAAVLVYLVAKSAIHEILAAVSFGMGTVALGVAVLISKADRQLIIFERLSKPKV